MTTTEILTGIKDWVLSKLSLKQDVINDLSAIRSGSQAGSTAVQPSDLSSYFNNASYDTNTHRINFYHGQNIVAYVDASPFIVDGMVDDVRIENGYLVIDFNTESGKQDISIPLTDIFDPSNYYNKTRTDGLLAQKQDVIQDLANIRSGAGAGATAVQPEELNSALSNTVAESGIFDLSVHNAVNGVPATYDSLSAAITALNALPATYKTGGMSFKFIHSSDNKYVQCRLMADEFTTDTTQWAIAEEGVYVENPEFVYVKTDIEGKILWAIKVDGSIYYGAGVPQQVKDYIEERISELSLDEYENIVTFLQDFLGTDTTLKMLLDSLEENKVDKEEGKSLIDSEHADAASHIDNPEYLQVTTDSEDKVLEGIKSDGTKVIGEDLNVGGSACINGNVTVKGSVTIDGTSYKVIENPEYVWAIIDNDDKILCGIKTDGKFVADIDGIDEKLQEAINQIQTIIDEAQASIDEKIAAIDEKFNFISWIEDPEGRSEITTDSDGKIVSYRDEEGVVHENIGIETKRFNSSDVYYRNQHKEVSLLNACRVGITGNGSSQNLQLTVVNDSHTDDAAMKRAVEITNRFHTIEGLLHCGDITQETYTPDYVKHFFDDIMSKCEKPWFITVGNHDAGNTMYVSYGGTHEDMYNSFIKPMIDAGNLAVGEYEVGKSYYFHDFPERKVRMIVTYDYDTPITSTDDLYESNYWEPIAYNASYPQLQEGHDYVYDANNPVCVNCGSYKSFSFRLKQSVHTTNGQYVQSFDLQNGWSRPAFKIARGSRVIRKDQADWFINTLANTPAEYGVVVVSHIPISANFQVQKDKKFTSTTYKDGYIYGEDAEYPLINMETDLFCDVIQAFIDRGTLEEHVVMMKENSSWEFSDARYMNVNTDPQSGEDYAYNISADFSNVPSSCHFISFVGGHHHAEIVYRHLTYRKLWAYHGVTLNQQYGAGDLARAGFTNTASSDNVNAISFTKNRMALVRIGNDETIYGKKRDFEVINTNND